LVGVRGGAYSPEVQPRRLLLIALGSPVDVILSTPGRVGEITPSKLRKQASRADLPRFSLPKIIETLTKKSGKDVHDANGLFSRNLKRLGMVHIFWRTTGL
jgi:hypothetical protein